MSGEWADDPAAVWVERPVRARVVHDCTACGEQIAPGHTYTRHTRINRRGDRPEVWKRCARCEAIYQHLVDESRDYESMPLPGLDCGHVYEDPPDEIAGLAFALPGDAALDGGGS